MYTIARRSNLHKFYNECAYFTAARYFRKVEQITNKIFEPTGLAPAYAYILLYLEDFPKSCITKIAEDLGYERTSVSRMLNFLQERGLVIFETSGRKKLFHLSSKSLEVLEIANDCLSQLKKLTDKELGDKKVEMTSLLTENYWKLNTHD